MFKDVPVKWLHVLTSYEPLDSHYEETGRNRRDLIQSILATLRERYEAKLAMMVAAVEAVVSDVSSIKAGRLPIG